jgi:hypothetical protein
LVINPIVLFKSLRLYSVKLAVMRDPVALRVSEGILRVLVLRKGVEGFCSPIVVVAILHYTNL